MKSKIFAIIPTFQRGGAERVMSLLSKAWSENNDVIVTCFDSRNPAYRFYGRTIDLDMSAAASLLGKLVVLLRRMAALAALFRRENPDQIIAFMESANFPAILAAILTGMSSRLTVSVRVDPGQLDWMTIWMMRMLYPIAGRVVTVSEGVGYSLMRKMGVGLRRFDFIPNPLDLDVIRARSMEVIEAESLPSRPFLLGTGRLVPQKGFDLLIRAMVAVVRNHNLDLVILGEGAERSALESLIADCGIGGRVHLLGAVDNPWKWMARCRLFVLSSRFEGWPNALAEAMGLGCAVVAFSCPSGPAEMVTHGQSGVLVREISSDALQLAIEEALLNDCPGRAMGRAAALWSREFELRAISRRWLN